jgi:Bacterial Ig-like domain (group 3)/FG-GAP-like repeat
MNGDGNPDLVLPVTSLCTTIYNCTPSTLSVLLGNGDGTFQPAVSFTTDDYIPAFGIQAVAATDVTGDGKPDVILANGCTLGSFCAAADATSRGSVSVFVNTTGLGATTTVLTSSLNPSSHGQAVSFTATVSGQSGTPTRSVTFTIGSNQPVTVPLSNGQAIFQWTFSTPGSFAVSATYSGDLNFAPSASAPLTQIVNPPVVTITGYPIECLPGQGGPYVVVTNTGNVTVSSLQVTIAGTTFGSGSLTFAPSPVTNLAPGASALLTLSFPGFPNHGTATLKVSGTYTVSSPAISGSWSLGFRSVPY